MLYYQILVQNKITFVNWILPYALLLFSILPPSCAAHTDTETHTIVKLSDYFQDFFSVSCLLGDKQKASPSYRKTQEERENHWHSET